uniref:Serine/threonine-protein kinase CDL1-like isoform X2 n=1 Tax=Rhizophora mucronata TaxID=61149 RepID=A0A2P2JVU8_RHIMU
MQTKQELIFRRKEKALPLLQHTKLYYKLHQPSTQQIQLADDNACASNDCMPLKSTPVSTESRIYIHLEKMSTSDKASGIEPDCIPLLLSLSH